MSFITKLSEYPNTANWGKSLVRDINKSLVSIETHLNTSFDRMKGDLHIAINKSIIDAVATIVERLDVVESLVDKNDTRITNIEQEFRSVKLENAELRSQIRFIESRDRRFNLIFKGVTESNHENETECINKIKHILNDKFQISNAVLQNIRIVKCIRTKGPKFNDLSPICVTFSKMSDRKLVWDERDKLRNVPEYYVCEDYAPDVQRRRRRLYQILNVAKKLPQFKDHT